MCVYAQTRQNNESSLIITKQRDREREQMKTVNLRKRSRFFSQKRIKRNSFNILSKNTLFLSQLIAILYKIRKILLKYF